MRNFTLSVLSVLFMSAAALNANAQCPFGTGMTATPLTLSGDCYFFVQFAIPNSNVSIYNADGYVAQGTANAQGTVVISYACSANPITGVLSLTTGGQSCNTVTISTPATLPVKYTSFTSQIIPQGVLLKWSTSYELNNEKFVVEKSKDGSTYESIGEIAGSENSVADKFYSFTDNAFRSGEAAYYRIRQVDIDGRATFSKVVYVNDSKTGAGPVKVFPNPFQSNEAIQITGISSRELNKGNIRVFNITGSQVNFELSGSNAIVLDPKAPAGVYVLKIQDKAYRLLKN